MRLRTVVMVLGPLVMGAAFAAQADTDASETANGMSKPVVAGHEIEPSFIKIFAEGHDETWFKSDFVIHDSWIQSGWEADHIKFIGNRVALEITREPKGGLPFTGAEYQRLGRFHFGRYEVIMRPAAGSGLVSAMFTHTDESQGDPHQDEVDIEFLGNRPREMQINYFTKGEPADLGGVALGFDASAWFQLYAFEWEEDEIRWYVGDELVHTARHEDHPIPQLPQRLMINVLTGSEAQYDWHGRPTFESGARAEYICISHQRLGDDSVQCSDQFVIDLPEPASRTQTE